MYHDMRRASVFIFSTLLSSCSSLIYWQDFFFVEFDNFVKNQLTVNLGVYFWILYSVPLICLSILTPIFSLVAQSLRTHGLQHARLPCPSSTPGVYSNLRPLSRWSHPLILFCPLLLPSIFPSIRVFSNQSVVRIR